MDSKNKSREKNEKKKRRKKKEARQEETKRDNNHQRTSMMNRFTNEVQGRRAKTLFERGNIDPLYHRYTCDYKFPIMPTCSQPETLPPDSPPRPYSLQLLLYDVYRRFRFAPPHLPIPLVAPAIFVAWRAHLVASPCWCNSTMWISPLLPRPPGTTCPIALQATALFPLQKLTGDLQFSRTVRWWLGTPGGCPRGIKVDYIIWPAWVRVPPRIAPRTCPHVTGTRRPVWLLP